jgi:5-methyltetrahydrofolate--homocysteine methyltransferase
MVDFEALKQAVIAGKRLEAVELTKQAVDEGVEPRELINKHLIPALNVVGDKFQNKEIFVPEMMIAARSMQACMEIVKPLLRKQADIYQGTVVIGTVFGDLHDIGKNLVKLLPGRGRPFHKICRGCKRTQSPGCRPLFAPDDRRPLRP